MPESATTQPAPWRRVLCFPPVRLVLLGGHLFMMLVASNSFMLQLAGMLHLAGMLQPSGRPLAAVGALLGMAGRRGKVVRPFWRRRG
jgi:hypothetical protein